MRRTQKMGKTHDESPHDDTGPETPGLALRNAAGDAESFFPVDAADMLPMGQFLAGDQNDWAPADYCEDSTEVVGAGYCHPRFTNVSERWPMPMHQGTIDYFDTGAVAMAAPTANIDPHLTYPITPTGISPLNRPGHLNHLHHLDSKTKERPPRIPPRFNGEQMAPPIKRWNSYQGEGESRSTRPVAQASSRPPIFTRKTDTEISSSSSSSDQTRTSGRRFSSASHSQNFTQRDKQANPTRNSRSQSTATVTGISGIPVYARRLNNKADDLFSELGQLYKVGVDLEMLQYDETFIDDLSVMKDRFFDLSDPNTMENEGPRTSYSTRSKYGK